MPEFTDNKIIQTTVTAIAIQLTRKYIFRKTKQSTSESNAHACLYVSPNEFDGRFCHDDGNVYVQFDQ